jgi:predicted metal-binding protein
MTIKREWIKEEQVAQDDPWKHRSEGMRCKTCISYAKKQSSNPNAPEIGRCRKHAPTMSGFPVVYPMDWCGDHRVDENKV